VQTLPNGFSGFPPALTAKQVAQVLQIPVKTVYDLGVRGELPRVKIGRTVRFPKKQIEALLEDSLREDKPCVG